MREAKSYSLTPLERVYIVDREGLVKGLLASI